MIRRLAFYVVLVVLLAVVLFPFYWVVATAFKLPRDTFAMPPAWLFQPTLDNFRKVLASLVFLRAFTNSLLVSISASALAVAAGALAAYGVTQQDAERRRGQEKFILSLRIAPAIVFVIPIYYLAVQLRILNQHWLLIAVYAFINVPFAISLLITFFDDIPRDLRDAARVDGASEFAIFSRIYLPAARGGVVATLILCVLFTWNEFFVALTLSGRDTQTLPVSLTSFLTFQGIQWGTLTAAATLIMLPMLVLGLLVQGQIVRGLTLGSVKG